MISGKIRKSRKVRTDPMSCHVANIEAWSKREIVTERSVQFSNVEKLAVADGSAVVASGSSG